MPVAQETSLDPAVAALGYRLRDADNHFYETIDAFTRYLPSTDRDKPVRWVTVDGKPRVVFGDRLGRYLGSNPTFSKTARPGVVLDGKGYGEIIDTPAEYQYREPRIPVMDAQGLETMMMFPTLGLGVEALMADDIRTTYTVLGAYNRWLDDEWGFNYNNRILAAPLMSLLDPFRAIQQLEDALSRGARVVHLRPGPVGGGAGIGRSPADEIYDGFWGRLNEADCAVVCHATDDSYRHALANVWGWGNVNVASRDVSALQKVVAGLGRPMHDTVASLIYSGLFGRYPNLRIAGIELGCKWATDLVRNLAIAGPGDLGEDPVEVMRRHVWVHPYEHEDLAGLAEAVSVERVLFGSDWPHTDALPVPSKILPTLQPFGADNVRKITHDNFADFVHLR